ncbi:MAG: hypothetical protein WAT58_09180 [Candidatus Dormiibacterota bacterium]
MFAIIGLVVVVIVIILLVLVFMRHPSQQQNCVAVTGGQTGQLNCQ